MTRLTGHSLYLELRRRGACFGAANGWILYEAPRGVLTPKLLASLQNHKPELMAFLEGDYLAATVNLLKSLPVDRRRDAYFASAKFANSILESA